MTQYVCEQRQYGTWCGKPSERHIYIRAILAKGLSKIGGRDYCYHHLHGSQRTKMMRRADLTAKSNSTQPCELSPRSEHSNKYRKARFRRGRGYREWLSSPLRVASYILLACVALFLLSILVFSRDGYGAWRKQSHKSSAQGQIPEILQPLVEDIRRGSLDVTAFLPGEIALENAIHDIRSHKALRYVDDVTLLQVVLEFHIVDGISLQRVPTGLLRLQSRAGYEIQVMRDTKAPSFTLMVNNRLAVPIQSNGIEPSASLFLMVEGSLLPSGYLSYILDSLRDHISLSELDDNMSDEDLKDAGYQSAQGNGTVVSEVDKAQQGMEMSEYANYTVRPKQENEADSKRENGFLVSEIDYDRQQAPDWGDSLDYYIKEDENELNENVEMKEGSRLNIVEVEMSSSESSSKYRSRKVDSDCSGRGVYRADSCSCALLYSGQGCGELSQIAENASTIASPSGRFAEGYVGSVLLTRSELRIRADSPRNFTDFAGLRQHSRHMFARLRNRHTNVPSLMIQIGKSTFDLFGGRAEPQSRRKYLYFALPFSDPFAGRILYPSCAIVGNSGSLLQSKYGADIDKHAAVFRFNDAPTEGFESIVGKSTTIRIARPLYLGLIDDWNHPKPASERVVFAAVKKSEVSAIIKWIETKAPAIQQAVKKHRSDSTNQSEINRPPRVLMMNPRLISHIETALGKDWERKHGLSLAIYGLGIAAQLCQSISLYGVFSDRLKGLPYHYYDNTLSPTPPSSVAEAVLPKDAKFALNLAEAKVISIKDRCFIECLSSLRRCTACLGLASATRMVGALQTLSESQKESAIQYHLRATSVPRHSIEEEGSSLTDSNLGLEKSQEKSAGETHPRITSSKSQTRIRKGWQYLISTGEIEDLSLSELEEFYKERNMELPAKTQLELIESIKSDLAVELARIGVDVSRLQHHSIVA